MKTRPKPKTLVSPERAAQIMQRAFPVEDPTIDRGVKAEIDLDLRHNIGGKRRRRLRDRAGKARRHAEATGQEFPDAARLNKTLRKLTSDRGTP